MTLKNIILSSKVTVNTVVTIFLAAFLFLISLYLYMQCVSYLFDGMDYLFYKVIEIDGMFGELLYVSIILIITLLWFMTLPLIVLYFFLKPKDVFLYSDRIYVETIGDIPLNKITSFDTPIFDYPRGHQTLHIRRKWRLPLRLAEKKKEDHFNLFVYKFMENIQKLPEHERPKFKTIHGSIIARLFGVAILGVMGIATFFALKMGHIPGTLILAWSAAVPISLLFIKGQRTP